MIRMVEWREGVSRCGNNSSDGMGIAYSIDIANAHHGCGFSVSYLAGLEGWGVHGRAGGRRGIVNFSGLVVVSWSSEGVGGNLVCGKSWQL